MIGRSTFSALAPVLGLQQKTVYGGQHDTKYVTFELLLHAAFVADEIWGFTVEPARTRLNPVEGHKHHGYCLHLGAILPPKGNRSLAHCSL